MVPVAALSQAWFYGRLSAGFAGSNRDVCMDVCLVCFVSSQQETFSSG
jgi:hypothetical protein